MKNSEDNAARIRAWCEVHKPFYAVILGSGLKFPDESVTGEIVEIPYADIPGLGGTSVKGHTGVLKLATINDRSAVIFSGRLHLYEGHSIEKVVYPVEFASSLGIENIILTNSAGGLNAEYNVGDIILLEDFLLMFDIGISGEYSGNIKRESTADPEMCESLERAGSINGAAMKRGTYAFMPGPAYETPAEVVLLRRLGADVVGMSTVPEWAAALASGLKVAALSLVTNVHTTDAGPPSHEEVLKSASEGGGRLAGILREVLFGSG